jgi:hypothetical protein
MKQRNVKTSRPNVPLTRYEDKTNAHVQLPRVRVLVRGAFTDAEIATSKNKLLNKFQNILNTFTRISY